MSVAFGAAATLAPVATARAFGVEAGDRATLALLGRLVGVRNATMGAGLLATGDAAQQRRALQLGLAVGASDVLAVLIAARRGVLAPRAVLLALGTLGGIAAAGVAALRD